MKINIAFLILNLILNCLPGHNILADFFIGLGIMFWSLNIGYLTALGDKNDKDVNSVN